MHLIIWKKTQNKNSPKGIRTNNKAQMPSRFVSPYLILFQLEYFTLVLVNIVALVLIRYFFRILAKNHPVFLALFFL